MGPATPLQTPAPAPEPHPTRGKFSTLDSAPQLLLKPAALPRGSVTSWVLWSQ